jgi:hypothetical protein
MKTPFYKTGLRLMVVVAVQCGVPYGPLPAQAQFAYGDFSSPTDLNVLNSAAVVGSAMRLNPASTGVNGTIYHSNKQSLLDGFETRFRFKITGTGGVTDTSGDVGGDGLALIIQTQGATYTGLQVPYIPYSIPHALAIEFDTYHNGPLGDPNVRIPASIGLPWNAEVMLTPSDGRRLQYRMLLRLLLLGGQRNRVGFVSR